MIRVNKVLGCTLFYTQQCEMPLNIQVEGDSLLLWGSVHFPELDWELLRGKFGMGFVAVI